MASPPADPPTVTRFAPSPTGYLHIGGARTALFNWLFARATGGTFRLRIEDTDRQRSSDNAVAAILDGLDWLGLDWDGDTVYQHAQADRHREIAQRMVDADTAYRCYASPQELGEMRSAAKAQGRPAVYDGRWRDRDPGDAPQGVDPVIRLKAPRTGETVVRDVVQGDVTFHNTHLDDLILLRSDGSPTYMLSVVVDDHDMGITHVVRGDDHLTNAARQSLIFDALGWSRPVFAHVPLIHGPDGRKLSKRHGALGIEAYREMGYLAEALRNYLVRLGWSHGDEEFFTAERLREVFNLDAIGQAPARIDFDKLANVNAHYIKTADDEALVATMENGQSAAWFAKAPPLDMTGEHRNRVLRAMPALKDRAKTLIELIEKARFLTATRPIELAPKAAKLLTEEARVRLGALMPALEAAPHWQIPALEDIVRKFAETEEIGLGKIAQPLRAALTGTTTAPGIAECLFALGRDEALARLRDQIA